MSAKLTNIIESIYDTVSFPELWPNVLNNVKEMVRSTSSMFCLYSRDQILKRHHLGIDDDAIHQYTSYYAKKDIWLDVFTERQKNQFYHSDELMPRSEFYKSEMYNDWAKSANMECAVGSTVQLGGRVEARICWQRGRQHSEYGREEISLLNSIVPHFKKALHLSQVLLAEQNAAQCNSQLLESMKMAALLVDLGGQVKYHNEALEAILQKCSALRLKAGRFSLQKNNEKAFLSRVEQSIRAGSGELEAEYGEDHFAIEDESGRYEIKISPFVRHEFDFAGPYRKVLALVVIQDCSVSPSVHALLNLYDLTPKEINLVSSLCQGYSLAQIAEIHSVSMNTAKTHLKNALQKTNCHSQAQLVARVLSGVSPLN